MFFANSDQVVLADERLAAGVDVHVDSQFLALLDNAVDLLVGQVQLVAVFRGPAAGAVQVAGGGGVQQDRPGDVAVLLRLDLVLRGAAL